MIGRSMSHPLRSARREEAIGSNIFVVRALAGNIQVAAMELRCALKVLMQNIEAVSNAIPESLAFAPETGFRPQFLSHPPVRSNGLALLSSLFSPALSFPPAAASVSAA